MQLHIHQLSLTWIQLTTLDGLRLTGQSLNNVAPKRCNARRVHYQSCSNRDCAT